jgi:hypothetical protein
MKQPEQFLLFNLQEGIRLGVEGMEKAAGAPNVDLWNAQADEYHESLPIGAEYSADDVVGHCGLINDVCMNGNNYVGPWFADMKAKGRIVDIRMIRSRRASNHGKKIPLYRKIW